MAAKSLMMKKRNLKTWRGNGRIIYDDDEDQPSARKRRLAKAEMAALMDDIMTEKEILI